ncbi:MAG: hypothetical protein K0Q50_1503 [Vampirovibrio sp.]|jgi:hypothetical protein|nr:hypothetical protein [Vampirovibrio sp.]
MAERKDNLQVEKPLSRPMWWIFFLMASYIMSLWFQTFKAFTMVPSLPNGLVLLAVMFLLGQVLMVLIYDSYVQEKGRGRIQKPIRLFEWMLEKRFLMRSVLKQKETIE